MKSTKLYFIPAIIFSIISAFLLLMPGSDLPSSELFELIYFDKWVHVGIFGLLTLLWGGPYIWIVIQPAKQFLIIVVLIISYGISIEFLQKYYTEDRNFDLFDIIADSIGVLLAYYVLLQLYKAHKKNEPL